MEMRHHAVGAPEQEEQLRITRPGAQAEMHHAIGEAARSGIPQPKKTCISLRGIDSIELHERTTGVSGAFNQIRQLREAACNQVIDERLAERSG